MDLPYVVLTASVDAAGETVVRVVSSPAKHRGA
jgi:hypothetical protein